MSHIIMRVDTSLYIISDKCKDDFVVIDIPHEATPM